LRNKDPEPGILIRDILFLKLNQRPPQAEKFEDFLRFWVFQSDFSKGNPTFPSAESSKFPACGGHKSPVD